jgi:hypothetical protein
MPVVLARFLPRIAVVAACLWVAILAAGVLARGPLFGDAFPLLVAHVHGLAQSIAARDADLWINGANLGYPAGTFAPLLPSLAAATLHALDVDLHGSIHLALIVPLVLLPLSVYVALRIATLPPWPAAVAACAAACALGGRFGIGVESAFAAALLDETWAVFFLPLAACLGARYVVDGRFLGGAVAASVACALCHPIVGASAALAWIVALAASNRRARVVVLVAFVLIGTMPMTLPALATWSAHGLFGPHLDDGDGGYAPPRFIAFLVRALDGDGAPVLTLAALAGVLSTAAHTVRSGATSRGVPFLLVAAMCALVLLLGPYLVWGMVPLGRFAPLLQLALCALVGVGVVDVVSACAAAVPMTQGARGLALLLRGALAISLAAIVVIAVNAQAKHNGTLRFLADDPELARDVKLLAGIARDATPPARVAAAGPLRTVSRHALAAEGWPGLWSSIGPSVSSSPNAELLSRNDVVDTVQVTNTGLILVAADAPQSMRPPGRAFVRAGRFHVYDTHQRAWFEPILLEAPVRDDERGFHEQALAWWHAQGYRTGRHLVADHTPSPSGRGTVKILEEELAPSRFTANIDVATDAPRAILLKVSWHPWWTARIDDKPVRVLRVSPELLAAEVPPGVHTLTFEFDRPLWTWLLWLLPFVVILIARRTRPL